jgi:hypothetical protein
MSTEVVCYKVTNTVDETGLETTLMQASDVKWEESCNQTAACGILCMHSMRCYSASQVSFNTHLTYCAT